MVILAVFSWYKWRLKRAKVQGKAQADGVASLNNE